MSKTREKKNVLIIGSGKRVQQTALPAFYSLADQFCLSQVVSRSIKTIKYGNHEISTHKLNTVSAGSLAEVDLIYLAVSTYAVGQVLTTLNRFDISKIELLIDTPVFPFTHLGHFKLFKDFRNVSVAEDCIELPWLDVIEKVVTEGVIGDLRQAIFFQSALKYHAVATLKKLLGSHSVKYARQQMLSRNLEVRYFRLSNRKRAWTYEPRDYSSGRMLFVGVDGSVTDFDYNVAGNHVLKMIEKNGQCAGFRIGHIESYLDSVEKSLLDDLQPNQSVTSKTHDLKKIGFVRLLRKIATGKGAYPLHEALDDMVIDHCLNKYGRYHKNLLTNVRSVVGRTALRVLEKVTGNRNQ